MCAAEGQGGETGGSQLGHKNSPSKAQVPVFESFMHAEKQTDPQSLMFSGKAQEFSGRPSETHPVDPRFSGCKTLPVQKRKGRTVPRLVGLDWPRGRA